MPLATELYAIIYTHYFMTPEEDGLLGMAVSIRASQIGKISCSTIPASFAAEWLAIARVCPFA